MANFTQSSSYKPSFSGNLNADVSGAVKSAFSPTPAVGTFAPNGQQTSLQGNGFSNPFAVSPLAGVTAGGSSVNSTPFIGPQQTGVATHTKQSILASSNAGGGMVNGKYVATGVNAGIDPYTVGQTNGQSNTTSVAGGTSSIPPAQTTNSSVTPNGAPAGSQFDKNGDIIYGNNALNNDVNNTPSAHNLTSASPYQVAGASYTNPNLASLSATTDSYMTPPNGYTKDANGNLVADPVKNDRNAIMDRLLQDTAKAGTKGDATNALNSQYGVDNKQQAYIDAYNQYNQKKVSYAQQENNFLNTNQGLGQTSMNQQLSSIQRNNNADLANLAVISTAAQGNYTAAMDIVKRKIDAEFDPVQKEIDNLSQFIQTNNDNLTKSDTISLENQRFQLQNNLELLKSAKTSAHQFALNQGINDPSVLARIDASTSPAQAYGAVGMSGDSSTSQSGQGNESSLSQTSRQYVDHSSDGVAYVDRNRLDNMTPYQKQIASAEYAKAGIRVLDSADVQALGTIDGAKQDLALFSSAADKLLSSGLMGRIKGYTTNQLAQLTQNNPEWRQFQTLRTGLIKSVQGVASGAPGLRVTGAELSNAAEALPNSFDNKESAQQAISTFTKLLDVNRNVLLRGSAPQSGQGTGVVQTKAGAINTDW